MRRASSGQVLERASSHDIYDAPTAFGQHRRSDSDPLITQKEFHLSHGAGVPQRVVPRHKFVRARRDRPPARRRDEDLVKELPEAAACDILFRIARFPLFAASLFLWRRAPAASGLALWWLLPGVVPASCMVGDRHDPNGDLTAAICRGTLVFARFDLAVFGAGRVVHVVARAAAAALAAVVGQLLSRAAAAALRRVRASRRRRARRRSESIDREESAEALREMSLCRMDV